MRDPKSFFSRPIAWLWLLLLWSLPALPIELGLWLTQGGTTRFAEPSLMKGNFFILLSWWAWVPVTPLIVRTSWRFPLTALSRARWRPFLIHLGLSLAVAIYVVLYREALSTFIFDQSGLVLVFQKILRAQQGKVIFYLVADIWKWIGVYALVAITAHGWRFYEQARERKIQLTEARMAALRAQIHPHFLFNTLNSISALMEDDVAAARRVMAQLASMLRTSLSEPPGEKVSLEEEVELARLYLAIEQIRFRDRLEIDIQLDEEAAQAAVPHLLLQPLVENAVRHGISRRSDAREIQLVAERDRETLRIRIEDDGPGPDALRTRRSPGQTSGIGLKNSRARLHQLYGEQGKIELLPRQGGGCRCLVTLPFTRFEGPVEASS